MLCYIIILYYGFFSFSGFSHYMLVINYAVRSSGVNARAVIFSYLHTFTFLPIPRSLFPAGFHAAVSIDFFQHHQNYYLKHVFSREIQMLLLAFEFSSVFIF